MKRLFVAVIFVGTGVADAKPLAGIIEIAAGTDHACAVLDSGRVACWGDVEPAPAGSDPRAPALVAGVQDAVSIAAAASGTCALLKSGEISCWGVDWYIGRGHTTVGHGRQPPGLVSGVKDAKQVAMGIGFGGACALHADGKVSCWGDSRYGHMGTPTKLEHNPLPVAVPGITTAVELAVGITGVCARLRSGEVTCWGDGSYNTAKPPRIVPMVGDAIGISVGQDACALRASGKVTCWNLDAGSGGWDLGVGSSIALRNNGVSIGCVVRSDRKVECWGSGLDGPGGVSSDKPVEIASLATVKQIAAGGRFACALRLDGTAACWGTNYARQLGRATPSTIPTPVAVRGVNGARAVSVGKTTSCALTAAGATCWGNGKPAALIANTRDAVQLAVGESRACVTTKASEVACWDLPANNPAVALPDIDDAVHVAVADHGTCVTRKTGAVRCEIADRGWSEIKDAVSVALTHSGGCARTTNNELHCWGESRGRPNQPGPRPAKTALMAKDVMRFDANGPLICWIGNGLARCEPNVQIWSDDGVSSGTPLVAIKDPSLVQIATGWAHACVRRKNGTVGCWGHNHGGQLGAGPIDKTPREALVTVKLAPAIDIAARENTTCAVVRGGGVWCWGYNRDGQVGNGTSGNVYTVGAPVEAP